MGRDVNGDQEIAGPVTGRGLALPLQPDLLAGNDAGRNLDVEFFTGRQSDALFRAVHRLFQRHRHGDVEIEIDRQAAGIELEGGAAAPRPRTAPRCGAAKHAVEDVLEPTAAASESAGPSAAGAEGVGLESAGATTRSRIAARKALEAWLAFGVDLAAIELLALCLIADDFIGGVQLGKTRGRFRIVLVGVGVMFLGKLAIGALDRRSAGAPRHPQDLIGVAHSSRLLQGNQMLSEGLPAHQGVIWGPRGIFATGRSRVQLCVHGFNV
jgi:hypothetical protein